ncbi:S8/S53 family peptidase [Hazenella sp. IB182357]|uniref:S8/S53 family peptidase n=1 Tax=Polycladospora coralii TaxID=2771432 RepID=A0A926RV86_9BACL|nr:S8/S53 family peptidase [Polycladospora coralii]MBD1373933.1 S8/S53 family peptidase [Polycladospora coralii]
MRVEPTWKRIGLSQSTPKNAGNCVEFIILDEIIPHVSLRHLKGRVRQVQVDKNLNIQCIDVLEGELTDEVNPYTTSHGVMVLNLLSHTDFIYRNELYTGLAGSARFTFIPTTDPKRIKAGLMWIIEQNQGAKIVLDLIVPQERGYISPTHKDPYVQALQPAIDRDILVVAAGGNSPAHTNQHPMQFFTIGGYNDQGKREPSQYEPHPAISYGVNGDGYHRPDILAPYSYLPVPGIKKEGLDFFGGTCGTSTLVAGLCAYLMSRFPDCSSRMIQNVLVETGDVRAEFPAPIVNGEKAIEALEQGYCNDQSPPLTPKMVVTDAEKEIKSECPLKRALALTMLLQKEKIERSYIWSYVTDPSPLVCKVAIHGLHEPLNSIEREQYWEQLHRSPSQGGVKEYWAYVLLASTTKEEIHHWLALVPYKTVDIRVCINLFLKKYFPDAPEIEESTDPDPVVMEELLAPVVKWYQQFCEKEEAERQM